MLAPTSLMKHNATTLISVARPITIRQSKPQSRRKKHTSFVFVEFPQALSSLYLSTSPRGRTAREHKSTRCASLCKRNHPSFAPEDQSLVLSFNPLSRMQLHLACVPEAPDVTAASR
jgi:hypothetical protein